MVINMWARIENDTVVEITDIDPDGRFHPLLEWVKCDKSVSEGWVYSGGGFLEPETWNHVSPVPVSVTMRQARLALHAAGLLSQVEAAIDALPEPPRTQAKIEWDFSSEVFRDRDFVLMLGTSLGLTSEQMDDLFITAAAL